MKMKIGFIVFLIFFLSGCKQKFELPPKTMQDIAVDEAIDNSGVCT